LPTVLSLPNVKRNKIGDKQVARPRLGGAIASPVPQSRRIGHKYRPSSNIKVKGQSSRSSTKKNEKKCGVISIDNAWQGDTCAVCRTLHAATDESIVWPPMGDGVMAVHVDDGLRAVLSGAVLAGAATPVGKSAHAV